jgi:hypothetical protein
MAAMGAVVLHAILLGALTMGASAGKRPQPNGSAAAALASANADGEAESVLIFEDPRALSPGQGVDAPRLKALTTKEITTPRLIELSAPSVSLDGDADMSSKATPTMAVDGAERAMLFGRYVGQINARIDRAWMRPSTSPSGLSIWERANGQATSAATTHFECRVQIQQSRSARVLEITLASCDSNPEWQQSLVNAIDAASPLPAPPSPSVFARSLVLNFTSAAPRTEPAVSTGGAR